MSVPSVSAEAHMRDLAVSLAPETALLEAAHALIEARISAAPVLDRLGNIVGVFSEKNALGEAGESGYTDASSGTVAQAMSQRIATVDGRESLLDAARVIRETDADAVAVMRENRLVGVLLPADVLSGLLQGN